MRLDDGKPSGLWTLLEPFQQSAGTLNPAVGNGMVALEEMVQGKPRCRSRRAAPVAPILIKAVGAPAR
jgi:hypothetical protein